MESNKPLEVKGGLPSGMGEGMIAGSIISSGFTAGLQASCIREQAKTLEALSEEYKNGWASLEKAQEALKDGVQSDNYKLLDNMNQLSAQMRLNRESYKQTYKQIQLVGIITIVIVFFLLFLKTFNLLTPLGLILSSPFRYVFSKI